MTSPTRAAIMAADLPTLRLWCAEYIFGYKWHPGTEGLEYFRQDDNFRYGAIRSNGQLELVSVPDYPADIAAAWLIIDNLKLTYSITIENCTDKIGEVICRVFVPFTNDRAWASADTAPLAICRAALLAVAEKDGRND